MSNFVGILGSCSLLNFKILLYCIYILIAYVYTCIYPMAEYKHEGKNGIGKDLIETL